jgi:peptidoglycan/xylan/chitin deacetylase (PgdA/CDA1 family)
MKNAQQQDTFIITAARTVYRSVRGGYRQVRALKNLFLNLIDPPIVILIYHRVTASPSDPEMIAVAPDNFRQQMVYLKERFRILRLDDDWSGLKEPAVVITFDDGYADNFLEALPILEEVGVPATFYISTGLVGAEKEFWWHELETMLLREGEFPSTFKLEDSRYGRTWDSATFEQRKKLYAVLSLLMRKQPPERQDVWLNQLEAWGGFAAPQLGRHRCMNREEIQSLTTSNWVTIGAHSVKHAALSTLSEQQQREEIFSSKRDLEEIIGQEVVTFSYPFGRKCEYNQASVSLCKEAGFMKVAANFPGQVHQWTDPMQLPRHLVRNWDVDEFAGEMRKFWTR